MEGALKNNPLYKQVIALRLLRSSEQRGRFQLAKHSLPIWTTMVPHSPEILVVNNGAVECASHALALEEGKATGKSHPVSIYCQEACNEIADLIDKQESFVYRCVWMFPLTQFSRALKVQKMATQCTILAQIIKRDKYCIDEPKDEQHQHLTLLRFYLQRLIAG